ncbi:MAG: hypothetical protein KDC46_05195 [Thermoleophilia bacterium]|nr:hypothetical protein [Thermoleophilia bacterium]
MAPAQAQAAAGSEHQAINFNPGVLFVDAEPGKTADTSVLVQNQTLVPVRIRLDVVDMQAPRTREASANAGVSYDYVEAGTAPRGAGTWIEPDVTEFRLEPGTQRDVRLAVDVPADAGAGGHFGAVQFTASALQDTGMLQADQLVPVPVFVTVAGAFRRDLKVKLRTPDTLRWSGGALRYTVELHNAGDLHENVSGRVRVDSLLSGSTSSPLQAGILLPGERRTQEVEFNVRSAPDLWRADVRVDRDGVDAVRAEAPNVWVIPIWLLVVLVAAIGITWWRIRARRAWRMSLQDEEFDDDDDIFPHAG